jgi:hypothetical protein
MIIKFWYLQVLFLHEFCTLSKLHFSIKHMQLKKYLINYLYYVNFDVFSITLFP